MPSEPQPATLAEVVRTAVEVCDDGTSDGLDDLLVRFEDADEPVTSVEDVQERLDEALGPLDADERDAPLTMARAVVVHLAHRRSELDAPPVELLRLVARAEFHGRPPAHVAEWLQLQGVEDR